MRSRFALTLLAALMIYPLSLGPVFAYYKHIWPMPMWLCRSYCPLFRVMPEAADRYLSFCGVSQIEAYFITDAPQLVPERAIQDDQQCNSPRTRAGR